MPGGLTEITEIATALGMLAPDLESAITHRPPELSNIPDEVWTRLVAARATGAHTASFATAFANGNVFLNALDGLRGRSPRIIEWKGPHRNPGDDVIPADLRIDHVYLVSCKYLSSLLLNPGPSRLFDKLLVGEERSRENWFATTAPDEFQTLYAATVAEKKLHDFPHGVLELSTTQRKKLKAELNGKTWPPALKEYWALLCNRVAIESAIRWRVAMQEQRNQVRLLWRMLRISNASYFVLGSDRSSSLRLRVDSAWDWNQSFDLRTFEVGAIAGGQPMVAWYGAVHDKQANADLSIEGHVEIRWSHGRFRNNPEAKVYLDTPLALIPGYNLLE